DDNASYKVYSFDQISEEGTEEGTIRRIFYKFDCDGGSKWAELNIEESNSYDTVIINQNGTDIKAEEFKAVKVNKQTGTETIVVGETSADGDRLFLKASSTSQTTNGAVSFDSYSFVIKNTETGNVVLNNTVAGDSMEYTFTDPGVYEITVSSSGDNNYKASTSEKTIIYVVNDPEIGSEKKLVISGSDIKYGERLDLNPVIIKDSQGAAADNINYTVMYGGNEITGLIEGNTFTPDKAGAYIINAVSDEPESDEPDSKKLTAAASINVSKRDLKVSVLNCEAPCNASETDKLSFISYDVEGDIDNIWADEAVNAVSDAFTATEAGRYPINLDVNTGYPVFEEIDSKYTLKLNGATYTLTSSAYKVTVDTENKGSSDISYIVDGADEPSFASSGDYIASGADVTVTALPNNGYVFKGWMNNGSNVSTNAVYEINSLSEDLNLKAIFEAVEHSKNYTVDYGTLNVGYTSKEINANPTVTGDKVLVKDSDYVITYYEIDENGVITQRCDAPVNIGRYLFVMSTVGDEISSVYGFEGGVPETITGENADEFIETFKCANILTITDSTAGHIHNYTAAVTTEPTCTQTGVKTFTCDCGESYIVDIPALGHSFGDWENVISATCGGDSFTERVCTECGFKETANVHAQDHIWASEYTIDQAATCTTDGSKSIHCSKCDATQFSTVIPATGHSYGDWTNVVADTCDGESYSVRTCSVCGAEEEANRHVQGHTWSSEYTIDKAATCTEDGAKSIHCTKCDATQFSTAIPALGHTFGDWEDKISETCGGNSYSERTCSVCGVKETANVHAQDHIWENEYTTDKEATCTTDGSKSIHCSKCDATQFSTSIPALGHSYGDWTNVVADTCDGESYSVRTCSVCEAEEIANRHVQGHTWGSEYITDKAATCTVDGSKSIHCTKCDATQFSMAIPALGHSFGEWEDKVSETCGGDSCSVRTCSVCGVT
ncbi:MAG: Ig-like domain repeat protein, partial [Clostridia bacterium]|nr:Ig-like domain repeat protein [Clostridia bacterium]